ncbi:DUF4184 family protein [Adhaeribacter aquaticus]|uniref:DUF4184 family protein n=1 Tax=Adhaeribacter aquaticus TaxID=299567 RepID=UPI0004125866|nr:DUF4184 family protein [Adhaeribacter aquaticus]
MPFTFSHPIAILPFCYLPKRFRSVTGLVVGSLVPDFEKFIRMRIYDSFSHTWPAIFYFNLPLGILLAFLFHNIVREPLVDNLPLSLRKRLVAFNGLNWNKAFRENYPIIIFSILIGVISHFALDSCTHPYGKVVQLVPALSTRLLWKEQTYAIFGILDRVISLVAILIFFFLVIRLPKHEAGIRAEYNFNGFWLFFGVLVLVIIWVRLQYKLEPQLYFYDLISTTIAAVLLSLLLVSCFVKVTILRS